MSFTTFDSDIWWFSDSDQSSSYSNMRMIYCYPLTAEAGKPIEFGVTIEYIRNEYARAHWLSINEISVHLRNSPRGENVVSSSNDTSKVILRPGGDYSHKFIIVAPPTIAGKYFPVLTFKLNFDPSIATNPDWGIWDAGAYYNQTEFPRLGKDLPMITIKKNQNDATLKVLLDPFVKANVTIDGKIRETTSGETKAIIFSFNSSHIIQIPQQVRNFVFAKWSDGDYHNPRRIILTNDLELFAIYKTRPIKTGFGG